MHAPLLLCKAMLSSVKQPKITFERQLYYAIPAACDVGSNFCPLRCHPVIDSFNSRDRRSGINERTAIGSGRQRNVCFEVCESAAHEIAVHGSILSTCRGGFRTEFSTTNYRDDRPTPDAAAASARAAAQ